jgi:hypothetical protein
MKSRAILNKNQLIPVFESFCKRKTMVPAVPYKFRNAVGLFLPGNSYTVFASQVLHIDVGLFRL